MTPPDDDVQDAFTVLDDAKVGFIDLDRFYTLWLGLGFDRTMTKADLAAYIPQSQYDAITLEHVLRITSRSPRNKENELTKSFELLDRDGSGVVTASDLVALAQEMGEDLSLDEAQHMIGTCAWSKQDLQNILSSSP